MTKIKLFEGNWMDYQEELTKYVTEDVIHKNWSFFIECHSMGALPNKAVKWL